ncbi:MAG TPA: LptA/OstA family protein [Steroidobacteraceae bacterium]|jgi:lipopolysaccharide export system protein LptA|nr:LptA/OstA family protein [Steroidobacteraceae bacterium]
MPAPRINSLLFALGTALFAGLLGARPAVQDARENLPINIDAASSQGNLPNNTMEFHDVTISQGDLRIRADKASVVGGISFQNGTLTVSGSVHINAQGGSLTSDEAVVTFANNVITRAKITGAPAEFEGHREGTPEPARGHARTIDYDITSGNVSLTGEAWLSDGCKEFRNEQMVYNIKTQSMEAQAVAPTAATGSDGRIHITIQPQTPGKPCAAPGKKTP